MVLNSKKTVNILPTPLVIIIERGTDVKVNAVSSVKSTAEGT